MLSTHYMVKIEADKKIRLDAKVIEHSEPGRTWYAVEIDGCEMKTAAGRVRRFQTGHSAQLAIDAERADRARRILRPDWYK